MQCFVAFSSRFVTDFDLLCRK